MNVATLESIFAWVLRVSWQASLVAALVLAVHLLLGSRISARWRFNLWLLVVLRLVLPVVPESRWSPFNLAAGLARPDAPRGVAVTPPLEDAPLIATGHDLLTGGPEVGFAEPVGPARGATSKPPVAPPAADDLGLQLATHAAGATRQQPPRASRPIASRTWLAAIWLAGVAACLGRILWATIAVNRLMRRATPVDNPELNDLLRACAAALGVRRPPAMLRGSDDFGPALVGAVRPRLVLPARVLDELGPGDLRMVLLHELAHQRRRDVALNWVCSLAGALHWFNPVVRLALRRMRADRELACDELALRAGGNDARAAYGPALIKMLETLSRRPTRPAGLALPAGAVGVLDAGASHLRRRITMIARFDRAPRRRPVLAVALSALAAAIALTGAVSHGGEQLKLDTAPAPAPAAELTSGGGPYLAGTATATSTAPASADAGDALASVKRLRREALQAEAMQDYEVALDAYDRIRALPKDFWPADLDRRIRNVRERKRAAVEGGPAGASSADRRASAAPAMPPGMEAGAAGPPRVPAAQDPPVFPGATRVQDPADQEADARASAALEKRVPVEFDGVPLADALQKLADASGVDVVTRWRTLEAAGIERNAPVTLRLREAAPAGRALSLILRDLSNDVRVGFDVEGGVVVVSTGEDLDRVFVTRAYDVRDLEAKRAEDGHGGAARAADLAGIIQRTVDPAAWAQNGGASAVNRFGGKLLVTTTAGNHREIAKLLGLLRAGAVPAPAAGAAEAPQGAIEAEDMTVEDIAQFDSQMANHLKIRDEVTFQMEASKLRMGANAPMMKTLEDTLDIRSRLIGERADWLRGKYKGFRFVPGQGMVRGAANPAGRAGADAAGPAATPRVAVTPADDPGSASTAAPVNAPAGPE